MHRFYRDLIALRHDDPDMADPWLGRLTVDYDEDQRWIIVCRNRLRIACNLGAESVQVPVTGEVVLAWASRQSTPTTLRWKAIRSPFSAADSTASRRGIALLWPKQCDSASARHPVAHTLRRPVTCTASAIESARVRSRQRSDPQS
ncbi:hypothetical protein BZL30_8204 [Mycobacterium kansasii]|uniref:DUF3459 domain-containing protein n=1 Tax=Mycobacterium kansasii TaxID=1768 RepID=A0A1V3WIJ5_MYCKA|nr:hypothetical protein BZL30_8204 [Mycobacterium kansasii]